MIVRKKDLRDRLEEQLRLGAAYLEEMNFDMALDAYAAAIDIDDREPRAYLGRADVYSAIAVDTATKAQSEEDIREARKSTEKAKEDLKTAREILSEDLGQEETDSYLEDARDRLESAEDLIDIRYVEVADLENVIADVLGLPYIGNTSYSEFLSAPYALRDESGYISAAAADLDGDAFPEVLVVSLEGEDSLGQGQNRLLLHVLEYEDQNWSEASRQDMEEYTSISVNDYALPLIRDVFLKEEDGSMSVFVEARYAGAARITWSLHRYAYNGTDIALLPVCEDVPADTELSAHGSLFFNNPAYSGMEEYRQIRSVLENINKSGLPVLDQGEFSPRLILSDLEGIRPIASFYRDQSGQDPGSAESLVNLTDWVLLPEQEREALEEEEEDGPEELTWEEQEALYRERFSDIRTAFLRTHGGNGQCEYFYFDMDSDGIFELFVNYADYNTESWGASLFTIKGGWVTELSLDYQPAGGEEIFLGVSAEGRPILYSYANHQYRNYEDYYDFTFYGLTKRDLTLTRETLASYTSYYDDIRFPDCAVSFYDRSIQGINFCDLMYRLRKNTKYNYDLIDWTVSGNTVTGTLFKSQGDGALPGGSFELHLDTASGVLYYEAMLEDYYATERFDLR